MSLLCTICLVVKHTAVAVPSLQPIPVVGVWGGHSKQPIGSHVLLGYLNVPKSAAALV